MGWSYLGTVCLRPGICSQPKDGVLSLGILCLFPEMGVLFPVLGVIPGTRGLIPELGALTLVQGLSPGQGFTPGTGSQPKDGAVCDGDRGFSGLVERLLDSGMRVSLGTGVSSLSL